MAIRRKGSSIVVLLVATVALVAAQGAVFASAGGNGTRWAAPLAGSNEVPAVDTHATGVATFKLSADGTSISYRLNVANIEDVRASHIHIAPEGSNGPVTVWLFGPDAGSDINGTAATGTITAADMIGPLAGQTIGDLAAQLDAGNAYVNVHTIANPGGEIRGQIK